jgi:hypothetical protein
MNNDVRSRTQKILKALKIREIVDCIKKLLAEIFIENTIFLMMFAVT